MALEDGEALLDELWHHAALPPNVWTQEWEVGDLSSGTTGPCSTAVTPSRITCGECCGGARCWLERTIDPMSDQPFRSCVEFSNEYDRRNPRALRGKALERALFFSLWDEVLPQRPLRAAARPHCFERRLGSLDGEHQAARERDRAGVAARARSSLAEQLRRPRT